MADEAFITSLSLNAISESKSDKLCHVRRDHDQLIDIVKKFGSKVSIMINNQRNDYMTAYENQMLEIKKELRQLQEKVLEIANDSTRDEKIRSLEGIQMKIKAESVLLDQQNKEMTKKLKSLIVTVQAAERDRDWLLSRLKKAKKINASLTIEAKSRREKIPDDACDLDNSNEDYPVPSALFGLYERKHHHSEYVIDCNRLTPIIPPGVLPQKTSRPATSSSSSRATSATLPNGCWIKDSLSATPSFNQHQLPDQYNDRIKSHLKSKEEKKDLSYLVMMRERKKGVRTVVQKCMLAAERGVITKQSSESISLSQLVLLCLESLEDSMKSEENYSQTMRLEKSNEDGSNNKSNHDNYRDDNHDNGDNNGNNGYGNYNHEDISSNQSGLNYIENNSKSKYTYPDNNDHNYDDNDKKKEYHTTTREEQLCNEGNRRARLAEKLLEHPETYLAVLDILDSKYLFPPKGPA